MKSTKNEIIANRPKYPCLMTGGDLPENEFVVLFTAKGKGTVVNVVGNHYRLGDRCNSWDEDGFRIYEGTIILENE